MSQEEIKELEAHTLEIYMKELECMVSMSELYRTNYSVWSRMVHNRLRYPSIYPTDEKIDWALIYQYEAVMDTPQHMLDLFISVERDDYGVSLFPIFTPEGERRWDMDTEGYMRVYGVDRPTALKIKSLYRKQVILEPEWVKVG
jgi:hypothetical protein